MPRPIHFEIAADNLQRAVDFYRAVFNWEIDRWGGPFDYFLASTGKEDGPGIDGAIMSRSDPKISTVNTIEVPALEEYVERVKNNGGKQIGEISLIPGVGRFTYCEDSEGNRIGLLESARE